MRYIDRIYLLAHKGRVKSLDRARIVLTDGVYWTINRQWRRFGNEQDRYSQSLSEQIPLNQKVAKIVVDTIIDSIKKAIVEGERVEIRGFGSFSLRSYKSYKGRNPKNGEIVDVPQKKLPYFKVGKRDEGDNLGKAKISSKA